MCSMKILINFWAYCFYRAYCFYKQHLKNWINPAFAFRATVHRDMSFRSSGYVILMSVMVDMLSANKEKRSNRAPFIGICYPDVSNGGYAYPQITRKVEILYIMCKTAINMELQTFMIKNFLRITIIVQVSAMKVHFQIAERSLFYLNPDIHYRRMAYPPERE